MIKVGIIGGGAIAQRAHIPSYQKTNGVKIIAISDSNEDKAKFVAKKFGIENYFASYEDLLKLKEIEAVSICTPNCFHEEQVIAALKAKKNVLCEKPLSPNVKGVEEIFREAEKSNRICMIAYMRRFMKTSQVLKEFIDNDELGQIYYAKASFLRRRGIPTPGSWFTSKKLSGGGCLIDIGVHVLDLSLWLMGNPEPKEVVGSTYAKFRGITPSGWPPSDTLVGDTFSYPFDVEDLASGFIKFDNGAALFLESSWAGNSEREIALSFFGTKGGAKIQFLEDASLPGSLKIFEEKQGTLLDLVPSLPQRNNPFREEIHHFIDCIKNGKEPITTFEEALSVAKIIEAIYKSAEEGREMRI